MPDILNIINGILIIPSSFFMAASLVVFLHCFHDARFQWSKRKAILLLSLSVLKALVDYWTMENLNFSTDTIYMLVAAIIVIHDFKGKRFLHGLRFFGIFNLLTTIVSLIVELSYNFFFGLNGESYNAPMAYVIVVSLALQFLFFGFAFFWIYHRLYRPGVVMQCGKRERIFIIVYSAASLIQVFIIELFPNSPATDILIGVAFLLCYAMLPIFLYYTRINQYFRERTAYQENYIQAELEHFTQYKVAQEETRLFRHDIRNNLLCVSEMLQDGKTETAATYLQELLNTTEGLRQKYVTGDEMLDCIVGVKSGIMQEKGIYFQLDGVLAGGLNWKPVDVCNVFANALDNAIEACDRLPPEVRHITMSIKATAQFWFIRIENPAAGKVDTETLFKEKDGYTTKQDSERHGIGTYNMKRTLEACGGMLRAESNENTFLLEIMIDKSQTSQ